MRFFKSKNVINVNDKGVLQNFRPKISDHQPTDRFSADPPATDKQPPTHR